MGRPVSTCDISFCDEAETNAYAALKVNILTEKFSFEIENCPFEGRKGRIKHPTSCDLSSYGAWSSYQSKHCPGLQISISTDVLWAQWAHCPKKN